MNAQRPPQRCTGWSLAGAVLLAGCAGTRAPAPPAASPAPAPAAPATSHDTSSAVEQFERRQRERAELASRQGRLADARHAWEVLQVLRPGQPEIEQRLAELQRRIQAQVADRLPKAAAAHKRGELDAAAQLYLGVLALNPEHETAAEGLRSVERDRNKRHHVGKLARFTLTRRPGPEAEAASRATAAGVSARPAAKNPPKATGDRNDVEHAAMLASQGEHDDAMALLQSHLAVQPQDAAAKRLLAELQAQRQVPAGGTSSGGAPARKPAPRNEPPPSDQR